MQELDLMQIREYRAYLQGYKDGIADAQKDFDKWRESQVEKLITPIEMPKTDLLQKG